MAGSGDSVTLRLVSPDGDQGFPGEVTVDVTYRVTHDELSFTWTATTTAPTVVAVTHHAHFQLAGEAAGSVEDHELRVAAETFTPVGADLLPTGTIEPVAGTTLDLRAARPLSVVLAEGDEQLGHVLEPHDVLLQVPAMEELWSPLLMVVPLQLLAYHVAVRAGRDVDQPRNLAKSVTVE